METHQDETTQLLRRAAEGDVDARDLVWERLYQEVLAVAGAQRSRWSGDWTLETRALANEVFVKLYSGRPVTLRDRGHFFAVLAKAVRQVLVNYSEARRAAKRGGDRSDVTLVEGLGFDLPSAVTEQLLDLQAALLRFEKLDERAARVVELRFFAGLPNEAIAEALGVGRATVQRDWEGARAWLGVELGESSTKLTGMEPGGGADP